MGIRSFLQGWKHNLSGEVHEHELPQGIHKAPQVHQRVYPGRKTHQCRDILSRHYSHQEIRGGVIAKK